MAIDLSSEINYKIPKTDLVLVPYVCAYQKAPKDSQYQLLPIEGEKAYKELSYETLNFYLNSKLGFMIMQENSDKILKINGKEIILPNKTLKKDLKLDTNGNICVKFSYADTDNEFYALISRDGKILATSFQPIEIFNDNIYKIRVKTYPDEIYALAKIENNLLQHFGCVFTPKEYYNYLNYREFQTQIPTSQKKSEDLPLHNGYTFVTAQNAKFGFNKFGIICISKRDNFKFTYFLDKFGKKYLDFKELLKADSIRRKNKQEPIIEDLDLLISDLMEELEYIEKTVKEVFKGKDIGKISRKNMPYKERILASQYDEMQIYLSKLIDIAQNMKAKTITV